MLPLLARHLPVPVPEPLALGEPGSGFPRRWSVVRWLTGETATVDAVGPDTAIRLAELVDAFQGIEVTTEQWLPHRGNADMERHDDNVRDGISVLGGDQRLVELWQEALDALRWDRPGRWLHADLHGGNLVFTGGELTGVIDWVARASAIRRVRGHLSPHARPATRGTHRVTCLPRG